MKLDIPEAAEARVAGIAVGWAWAVLGPPGARIAAGFLDQAMHLLVDAMAGTSRLFEGDWCGGNRYHDAHPYVVRAARGRACELPACLRCGADRNCSGVGVSRG